jgi:adenylate cyclase
MTDSAPPEDASALDYVARPAASRWARVWEQVKRFRAFLAGAAVIVVALIALAFVRLPVWQTIATIASVGAVLGGLAGFWNAYAAVKKSVPLSGSSKSPVAASALSVLVLPFHNHTGDANQAYVADGLTANVTADLSRIRDAFIVNATTAFAYKDKPITAQQAGIDLGVRFVLHGSVQRSGTKIRINAQLADTSTNAQLWADSFEGDQSDLFALQDQVTARIGNSIEREVVIVAARESETRKSSPKVADLILRARAMRLKPQSLRNLQQAEELYRHALALEPNNAGAMIGLAVALAAQAANFGAQMDEGVREKKFVEGRDLALKAKEIDPDNPRVYVPIQRYAEAHGDWGGALRAAETQLSLAPNDPVGYNNVARPLIFLGEPQRAFELLTRAINLEPKHPREVLLFNQGHAYFMLGDNDSAIECLQKSLQINPQFNPAEIHASLAMMFALKGDAAKARDAAAEFRLSAPDKTLSTWRKQAVLTSAAYKEWFENKLVPAWREAGLPE